MLVYYRNCLKYSDHSGYVDVRRGELFRVSIDKAYDFPTQESATALAEKAKKQENLEFVSVRCSFEEA